MNIIHKITLILISILIAFTGVWAHFKKLSETDVNSMVICPNYCGRFYRGPHRKYNLKKHLKLECGVKPMFSCTICLRRFTRNENLKRHLILVHESRFENIL